MDSKGIQRVPGCSQIEINGKLHSFVMRDYTHLELDEVFRQVTLMQQEYPNL